MSKNYMEDQNVRAYYDVWIHGPTLFEHSFDREQFYKFVKACINYVGRGKVFEKLDRDILRLKLYDDFKKLREENYEAYENIKHKIIVEFETLLEYEDAAFP